MPKNTPGPRPEGNWLPIPGYEGAYEVSDDGRVWSVRRPVCSYVTQAGKRISDFRYCGGHVMQQAVNRYGYPAVGLRIFGKKRSFTVHRLVLEAFVGPCPDGMEACHKNDDPTDNRLVNLRWGSHVSNIEDRDRGRVPISHCKRAGHAYTPENTYVDRKGRRHCRECYRKDDRERRRRYKAEARLADAG